MTSVLTPIPLPYGRNRRRRQRRTIFVPLFITIAAIVASHADVRSRWLAIKNWLEIRECLGYTAGSQETVVGRPACWSAFFPLSTYSWNTAFVHARTTRSGLTRLVAVDFWIDSYHDVGAPHGEARNAQDLHIASLDVIPDSLSLSRPWEAVTEGTPSRPVIPLGYGNQALIYNGQPDPHDPAHFTIAYMVDGHCGRIDGHLVDTPGSPRGQTELQVQLRDGPGRQFQ
jgi:hypothetical protein